MDEKEINEWAKKHPILLVIVILVILVFGTLIAMKFLDMSDSTKKGIETVTYSEYLQVKEGMSYDQVVAIAGFEGEESSSSGSFAWYSWVNPDGSNMVVSFEYSKVTSKTQLGLG